MIDHTRDFDTIPAAQVREGDLIQQAKGYWPAQTVTSREEHYGRLTFNLSGGSRVTGVDPSSPFVRYVPDAVTVVESVNEGQLDGQLRLGGEDVRTEITEDFFLTQTAPAPKAPAPAPAAQPGFWDDAEVIHTYTRADAIRDGVLVPVADTDQRQAGIMWPLAMTAAAYADTVTWTGEDERRKPEGTCQDEAGRLWDVLTMTRIALAANARRNARVEVGTRVPLTLIRVPREGRGVRPRKVTLHAHIGPNDDNQPCITLMLPTED